MDVLAYVLLLAVYMAAWLTIWHQGRQIEEQRSRLKDLETKVERGLQGFRGRLDHIEHATKVRNGRINHRLRRLESKAPAPITPGSAA